MNLVDPSYELIDPCPDIHALFLDFNDRFFEGKLVACEVKWSPRMTTCAGVCSYQFRAGYCSIRLSKPLLTLRPRKDLVETLLHEMIHAYLFVTARNQDRDGHGPEFKHHMHRINGLAGTKITIYHTFHAEVANYKTHHWKCDGPCASRQPYFGIVKRASNRAPGPNDFWFAQHKATCGGTFHKIKEPEGYQEKKKAPPKKQAGTQGTLDSWGSPEKTKKDPAKSPVKKPKGGKPVTRPPKLNTLDGWISPEKASTSGIQNGFAGSGTTLGGGGNGVSRLLGGSDGSTTATVSGQRLGGTARGVSALLDRLENKGQQKSGTEKAKEPKTGNGAENRPSSAGSSWDPIVLDDDDDDWMDKKPVVPARPVNPGPSPNSRPLPRHYLDESYDTELKTITCPFCGIEEFEKYIQEHIQERHPDE